MSKQGTQKKSNEMSWELESKLEPGMLRFLAHVIEDGLQNGLRTQEDFIRHFPPIDIMKGLAERPDLRANILVPATGVRSKIASKKSAESAGQDLQIALDEGETDASLIVSLFHPDDRVRYLDTTRLWNYIIEPRFWTQKKDAGEEFDQAKSHLAFILERAIEDRLVTHRDIVDGMSVATMVQYLPLEELQAVIEKALTNSHNNKAFTEQDMLRAIPLSKLVENVPLSLLWERVVCPKIAEANSLATGTTTKSSASSNKSKDESDLYSTDQPGIMNGEESETEKKELHSRSF